MARQYSVLLRHPSHLAIRSEQMKADFNGTVLAVLETIYPTHNMRRLLPEVQRCDLATWTEERHKTEPEMRAHVTSKRKEGLRNKLVASLMAAPDIADHLCLLARKLDYHLEPNCMQKGIVT